jgi:hypothetical protein
VTLARPITLLAALLLCAPPLLAQAIPNETPIGPTETHIPVPAPAPSGLLLAWKPMILTVRTDTGAGSKFGSDNFQPLRGLARYTFMAAEGTAFFGRIEAEGGQFATDTSAQGIGSKGWDVAARLTGGAATRIWEKTLFIASIGAITRYQHGSAEGGAPTIGMFGVMAAAELEYRILPIVTLSVYGEAAVAPFPYGADANLGDLSDASEVRGRIQLSVDLTRDVAVDVGYDFTRWHSTFVSSTILGNPLPDQALIFEAREYAFFFGVRWRF